MTFIHFVYPQVAVPQIDASSDELLLAYIPLLLAPDDQVIFSGSVLDVACDPAVGHLRIPFFQLLVKNILKSVVALDYEHQMVAPVYIGTYGEAVHHILEDPEKDDAEGDRDVHSGTDGESEARSHPDSCGSCQTSDITADFEDDTCTQKAYAADDLGCDS